MALEIDKSRKVQMKFDQFDSRTGVVYSTTTWSAIEQTSGHTAPTRRRRPLQLDFTPYVRYSYTGIPGKGVYINGANLFGRKGTLIDPYVGNTLISAKLLTKDPNLGLIPVPIYSTRARAENKALKLMKNQKLNFALAMAEGRETLAWIASYATGIVRAVDAVRDGSLKRYNRQLRKLYSGGVNRDRVPIQIPKDLWSNEASKRWLECNFALLPLLEDMEGLGDVMTDFATRSLAENRGFVYASAFDPIDDSVGFGLNLVQSGFAGRARIRGRSRYSVGYMFLVQDAEIQRLASLGLTNLASTLYASTPMSFVLDWGLNVGSFLDNWDATLGLTCIDGFSNCFLQADSILACRKTSLDPRLKMSLEREGLQSYRGFVRRKTSYFPYPSLYFKNPVSGFTVTAAAALIRQRIGELGK